MECELLVSNFKDPKMIDLVDENIGRISDGSSSHSANVLKLGLKMAFDLKKQKQQPLAPAPSPAGTKLQCFYCHLSTGPGIPRFSVGSEVRCPCCGGYYMTCVSCEHHSINDYELRVCQSCEKMFEKNGIMWETHPLRLW